MGTKAVDCTNTHCNDNKQNVPWLSHTHTHTHTYICVCHVLSLLIH